MKINSGEEMDKHAEYLYNELNWGPNYYVGLLIGDVNCFTGRIPDTIFPKLN